MEEAQLDIWVDQEENFNMRRSQVIVGTGLNAVMPDATGRRVTLHEYSHINQVSPIAPADYREVTLEEFFGVTPMLPHEGEVSYINSYNMEIVVPLE